MLLYLDHVGVIEIYTCRPNSEDNTKGYVEIPLRLHNLEKGEHT